MTSVWRQESLLFERGRVAPPRALVAVAVLRSELLHDWQPPGGGAAGALSHAVIQTFAPDGAEVSGGAVRQSGTVLAQTPGPGSQGQTGEIIQLTVSGY